MIDSLVLAVDDEPAILRLLKLSLSGDGFKVLTATNGEEALQLQERHRPDAAILDIQMPGMTGLELMRRIRDRSDTPIIFLTGRDRDADILRGLELGADDYLPKPFSPAELGARVHAIIRRANRPGEGLDVLRIGEIEIDLANRSVCKNGEPVSLTRTEWQLLRQLASRPGSLIPNAEILTKVWGPEYVDDLEYLRVRIWHIRNKIETDPSKPRYIKTFHGQGYLLGPTG